MKSSDLTEQQIERLHKSVTRQLGFFNALLDRMRQNNFPSDDPLRLATQKAQEAVRDLFVAIRNPSDLKILTSTESNWAKRQRQKS